ncbi:tetratricopeptide repeat protein [Bradyrhizobium oligotrophicum S58]
MRIEASLARRPDHAAARLLAARIARVSKDFDGALAHVDRAIALSPRREAFIEKARILDQAGMAEQAQAAWQAILKVIPEHDEALARLGRLSWENGDFDTARTILEQAASPAAPASVWFDLGLVRQDVADLAGAAAAYRRALAIKPDHAEAALNLGIVLQESGDPDAAMQAYARAYRLRSQMFGAIAMALTSAPHGRLWIDPAALKRALKLSCLGGRGVREISCGTRSVSRVPRRPSPHTYPAARRRAPRTRAAAARAIRQSIAPPAFPWPGRR